MYVPRCQDIHSQNNILTGKCQNQDSRTSVMPSPAEQVCRCPSPWRPRQQLESRLLHGTPQHTEEHTAAYQQTDIHRMLTIVATLRRCHCFSLCSKRVVVVSGNNQQPPRKPSGRVNGFKGQHSLIILILGENRVTSARRTRSKTRVLRHP